MTDCELHHAIIFKALTKPAMFLGVDYDFFYIACLVVMLVFIFSDNFLALLIYFPLHFCGWLLCQIDPAIFKLLSIRANIGFIKNKSIWSCQSYEAY
jgi:type IV secretory pathway VirB3-like protein